MPSEPPVRLSGPAGWAMAGIAAVALFAGGALTARAFFSESGNTPRDSAQVTPGVQEPASGASVSRPSFPASTAVGGRGEDAAGSPAKYGFPSFGCMSPLPTETLGVSAIDLPAAGIQPRVPRSGFELISISLSSMSDCDAQGQPTGTSRPVLGTTWRHTATGLEVYLSQVVSSEPVAPILRTDGATFSALGYLFSAYVNAYPVRPLASDLPAAPIPDPRAEQVLREVIAQVAPGFDQQCFWVATDGDWGDLPAFGIGDPRPAIPSGMNLSESHITAFKEPAAGCDTSVRPTEGFGLYASWQGSNGHSLGVSVTGLPPGSDTSSPGYIDQYSASWTNRGIQFSVWYASEKPDAANLDVIRAVARALDPSFDDACFVSQRQLTAADLGSVGLREPTPPTGYAIVGSWLTATDIAPGCARPAGFIPSYNLHWTLERGADTIDVNVYASPGSVKNPTPGGWIGDYGLGWVAADGTSYSISGYSEGVNPNVSRDDLIAVARSLDPSLDISILVEEKGGAVPSRPAPDAPRGD